MRSEREGRPERRPGRGMPVCKAGNTFLWQLVICVWASGVKGPVCAPSLLGSTVRIESLGTEASRHLCAPLKLAPAGLPYHWVFGSLVGSLRRGNLADGLGSLAEKPPGEVA